MDEQVRVPKRLAQVIYDLARLGPDNIKAQRKQALAYYKEGEGIGEGRRNPPFEAERGGGKSRQGEEGPLVQGDAK